MQSFAHRESARAAGRFGLECDVSPMTVQLADVSVRAAIISLSKQEQLLSEPPRPGVHVTSAHAYICGVSPCIMCNGSGEMHGNDILLDSVHEPDTPTQNSSHLIPPPFLLIRVQTGVPWKEGGGECSLQT